MKLSESRSLRKITISLLINKGHKDFEDLETQGPRYNFVPINPKDEREQVKESLESVQVCFKIKDEIATLTPYDTNIGIKIRR